MSDIVKSPKSLIAKPSMGALAASQDPAELEALVTQRYSELYDLSEDTSLSEEGRNAARAIATMASPSRPGMEEVISVWKIPRINIVQPVSQSEAKPEAARPGDLYTSAGQLLERPWAGIPLYFYQENINFPSQGRNPVCSAPDAKMGSPFGECAKCPHLPFGLQNGGRGDQRRTDCTNNIVAIMLSTNMNDPQVYMAQFGKTSRKAGNTLLSLAGQQRMVWKQSYLLNTEKKTGERGLYYLYKVEPTSKDNPEHVLKVAEKTYALVVAQRKLFLANVYNRVSSAASEAAAAEAGFDGSALDANLVSDGGVEPDLSAPPTRAKSARTSAKPM